MSFPGASGDGRRPRLVVNTLWVAAAATVVAGFVLRALSSVLGRGDLRVAGVALIAVGLGIAVLGWVGERIAARRAP
jgi:ABC-type uncharacterized transport system permease subunit